MKEKLIKKIEKIIANYWLKENLYCGLSASMIKKRLANKNVKNEKIINLLQLLEKEEKINTRIIYGDLWVYPKEKLLRRFERKSYKSIGKYTKQLRRGGRQLDLRFFSREVLARYKDPHYNLIDDGFSGYFSVKHKWFLDPNFPEEDKVGIQRFGPAYLKDGTRVLAVILKDLEKLSARHQNYWSSFEIEEKCLLDKDFYDQNFKGEWVDRISPFQAILEEIKEINKICKIIHFPNLFLKTWDEPPVGFSWIAKPTKKELENLGIILNNIIIDNFNKDFFKGKVSTKNSETGEDFGTIVLLDNFIKKFFHTPDRKPIEEFIATLKEIREIRRLPVHTVEDDDFDPAINKKQTDLVAQTYLGLNILRQIFMRHPLAKSYHPPDFLDKARIA